MDDDNEDMTDVEGFNDLNSSEWKSTPTVAEIAFLAISRDWEKEVAITKDRLLPRSIDVRALSCIMLAVEWGSRFTNMAREQITYNIETAAEKQMGWIDLLPWELCSALAMQMPIESEAVQKLIANLDHHDSSIRIWMMEMAWFAHPWLNPVEATVRLLNNLGATLAGPFRAAGLAARFFDKEDKFLIFAHGFTPPEPYEQQYRDRLKYVEEHGILELQAAFWKQESECRKAIEQAAQEF